MSKRTKSERFKYVFYDPGVSGFFGNQRTKKSLGDLMKLPWVGMPYFNTGCDGARRKVGASKRFATEREAALFVDKWFIDKGRPPVNILIRKP